MRTVLLSCTAAVGLLWPALAQAQTPPAPLTEAERASAAQQLEEIRAIKQDMSRQIGDLDARIGALEAQLGATPSPPLTAATPPAQATVVDLSPRTDSRGVLNDAVDEIYQPGRGIVLASGEWGELDTNLVAYVRYLNQLGIDDSYTDSFGRTFAIDRRQEAQFQKVTFTFKGWLIDPRFRYLVFFWTANTSQGLGAQVVIAGNLKYKFNDHLTLAGGIGALPTTRSTLYTYPNWVRVDNRPMADEFFRGSYTSGFWAEGEIVDRVQYRVMIANNLSTLGVDSAQLDDSFSTVSGAVWWMPTTGEFGFASGFGDYDYHQELATLFGVSYTRSPEDAESQPGVNDFENTQLRLSDGTRLFMPDAFDNGSQVTKATYQMASVNAGFKYRGWSLEGEYYARWIDDFETTGPIPIDEMFDQGFQLQASFMPIRDKLQLYASGSMIFGEYGSPSDVAVGVNWFPLSRREFRINAQALYVDDSPVGYAAIPYAVGADGWIFTTDFVLAF